MTKLLTNPYKGARDFYPEDWKIQNYIFEIWRKVCLSYGFEEYNGPFLEPFELYKAKSGEELVNEQLYSFEDKGGRKVAIRPEMTPSVARMVAAKSKSMAKPIKWFSIANFWRYEKPQRGRLREFFQLNCDIFGEGSILSDFEVFTPGAEIMKQLGATAEMYEIKVNSRLFVDFYLKEEVVVDPSLATSIFREIDRIDKIPAEQFTENLGKIGLNPEQIQKIQDLLNLTLNDLKKFTLKSLGAKQILEFFNLAKNSGLGNIFVFSPKVVRGLDYYTGLVIEQWDKNPKNNRSMYGGGRYDNLTDLFEGAESLAATGFAMGDVTLINFLKSWNLMPNFSVQTKVLVTVMPGFEKQSLDISQNLRSSKINTELYLNGTDSLEKQIKYADKKSIPFVVIIGEEEALENRSTVKNLKTREQKTVDLKRLIRIIL